MAKRSRLKIIYPVSEDDLYIAIEIKNNNLERLVCSKVAPDTYEFGENKRFSFPHLKKSWLTEIKEPLTVEEWFKNKYPIYGEGPLLLDFQLAWKDWDENQKLGMVVDEEKDDKAFYNFCKTFSTNPNDHFIFWKAALKHARGQS